MKNHKQLQKQLNEIDGNGYGAYKQIKSGFEFPDYEFHVDYVQGDPYAAPSKVRVRVDQEQAQFPADLYETPDRQRALEDFLIRKFDQQIDRVAKQHRGSGKSGLISTIDFGQAILDRTAMYVNNQCVEVRFFMGLPARGRSIMSRVQAQKMIFNELPRIIENALFFENLSQPEIKKHIRTVENAEYIRDQLSDRNLVAFVKNDAILPRESGVGDQPMQEGAVPFESPESLQTSFELPDGQEIEGMGIPEGITLIVGGGYHGKSTLLNALAQGVYNHVPGDGREYVVTNPRGVMIRAEDDRYVENVDISPFINNIPSGINTEKFSTRNASGSTSQATNIMESLEAGSDLMLIDEDISATNFMIRDERMQRLVGKEEEPITPLLDNIELLHSELGVSTILVMGGSGDYFEAADTVIKMEKYQPVEVTEQAQKISEDLSLNRTPEGIESFGDIKQRYPDGKEIDPRNQSGKIKIKIRGKDAIQFGEEEIDLSSIHQITESPQLRSIGEILFTFAKKHFQEKQMSLREALDDVEEELQNGQLHQMIPFHSGHFAVPRKFEIAAALNRLRTLVVNTSKDTPDEEADSE